MINELFIIEKIIMIFLYFIIYNSLDQFFFYDYDFDWFDMIHNSLKIYFENFFKISGFWMNFIFDIEFSLYIEMRIWLMIIIYDSYIISFMIWDSIYYLYHMSFISFRILNFISYHSRIMIYSTFYIKYDSMSIYLILVNSFYINIDLNI